MTGFAYSRGRNAHDNMPAQRSAPTFDRFIDDVTADGTKTKSSTATPYICGPLANDRRRCAANEAARRFLVIDVDHCKPERRDELLAKFRSQFKCAVWTTHSSTPQAPRFRVFVELGRNATRSECMRVGEVLSFEASQFGDAVRFDPSTFRNEQPVYCPPAGTVAQRFNDAAPLDVDTYLAIAAVLPAPLPSAGRAVTSAEWKSGPDPDVDPRLIEQDDAKLIDKAIAHKTPWSEFGKGGPCFADSWTQNEEKLQPAMPSDSGDAFDRSRNDWLVVCELAYQTGCDPERIERLMLDGPLAREKWDTYDGEFGTWLRRTILKACAFKHAARLAKQTATPVPPPPPALVGDGIVDASGSLVPVAAYGEVSNSREFARRYSDRFRYAVQWKKWLAWDGTRWKVDENGAARLECKALCDATAAAAADDPMIGKTPELRQRAARQFESKKYVDAVLDLARVEPELVVNADDLDADRMLFNTPGGTIDLRQGFIRPHARADLITKCARVAPAGGPIPHFGKFLGDITRGDAGLIHYLQCGLGSILSGAISDHWLQFWFGDGRNGKNTLGDQMLELFGDYAAKIPATTLMADKRGDRHPTEIAVLRGLRLVISSEVNAGDRWHEARIKELTGDAWLAARFMFGDQFNFRRTHKHVIYGNHRPSLVVVDRAIVERMHLVPFDATFSVELGNLDPQMPAKLAAEAPQILAWLMEGHRLWAAAGTLVRPEKVRTATQDYFDAQSTPAMWVRERCNALPLDGRALHLWPQLSRLFADYVGWKTSRNEGPLSQPRFADELRKLYRFDKSNGVRVIGLEVKGP